eukprot:8819974-Lingulodinium_polyedra.AAC.1
MLLALRALRLLPIAFSHLGDLKRNRERVAVAMSVAMSPKQSKRLLSVFLNLWRLVAGPSVAPGA